jgi:Tfp pilus assembly protein PilZ
MKIIRKLQPIYLEIQTSHQLKEIYIPFLKARGLFIPLNPHVEYKMGEILNIKLKILEDPQIFDIHGKVVLLPQQEQDPWVKGIGIEFIDLPDQTRQKMEFIILNSAADSMY